MPETIAQMVAVISADSSAFDARLTKVEEKLELTRQSSDELSKVMTESFARAANGTVVLIDELVRAQKEEKNLADYQYQIGLKTTEDMQRFLSQRMQAFEVHTTEWRSAAMQSASIEIEQQRKVTANLEAEQRKRQALSRINLVNNYTGDYKRNLADYEKTGLYATINDSSATMQQQAVAAERVLAIVKAEKAEEVKAEEVASSQRMQAISNLAKFEYEQGNLSLEAYRAFLQQKMALYEAYSAEWKSASFQLLSLEREQNQEALSIDKELTTQATAIVKEQYAARIAANKEYNAFILANNKSAIEENNAQIAHQTAYEEQQKAQRLGTNDRIKSIGSGLGNIAAGITGVELASAIMESKVEGNLQGLANNTTMTTAQFADMRDAVMKLAKDSGASFEDLGKGYMYVADFGYKGADALNILTLANKEAVGTMSSTGDIAKAEATALHIFGAGANEAAGYIDVLHHAAASGKMTVQQFVDAGGPALAIVAAFGGKFADAAAMVSALSKAGFSAAEAATQVKGIVSHIGDPSNSVTKTLKDLEAMTHIPLVEDFTQKGIATKGLMGVFDDLFKAVGNDNTLLAKIIPALRGGIGSMTLLNSASKDYKQIFSELLQLQQNNSAAETQGIYNRMLATSAQQLKVFANTVQTDFMPAGKQAADLFLKWLPTIKTFSDFLLHTLEAFQKLPEPIQNTVTVIGGLVILEKFTGILSALKIPAIFTSSLGAISGLLPTLTIDLAGFTGAMTASITAGNGAALSAAGLSAALGPAVLIAALAGVAIEIGFLVVKYNEMRDAQDQAAASAKAFADKQKSLSNDGNERDWLAVDKQRLAIKIADLKGLLGPNGQPLNFNDPTSRTAADQIVKLQAQLDAEIIRAKQLDSNYHHLEPVQYNQYGEPTGKTSDTPQVFNSSQRTEGSGAATAASLLVYQEHEKALERERKAAEKAEKALQNKYKSEIEYLLKVIALGKQKEDLDENNYRKTVEADLASGGKLFGIHGSQATILRSDADRADQQAHAKYLDDIISKANDKEYVSAQSDKVQSAIELVGGLDKWKSLGDGASEAQKKVLNAVDQINSRTQTRKAQEELADLTLKIVTLGDAAKQAAITALAGGSSKKWKQLAPSIQIAGIGAEQQKGVGEGLISLATEYSNKMQEAMPPVKTASEAAERAIDSLMKKYGIAATDPRLKQFAGLISQIRKSASGSDTEGIDNWFKQQESELLSRSIRARDTISNSIGPDTSYGAGQSAVDKWVQDITSSGQMAKIKAVYKDLADYKLKTFEDEIRQETVTQYNATKLASEYSKATSSLEDVVKQANLVSSSDPFQKWLDTYMEFQRVVESDGTVSYKLGLPTGTDVGLMKEVYSQILLIETKLKAIALEQEAIQGLSSSITNGLFSAFNVDSSQRGSAQSNLLSLQAQYSQYQIAEAEFKNKYPGDPNDPYTQRLTLLSKQISDAQKQFDKLGNDIGSTFNRVWQNIEQGFTKTLANMAQQYLQSLLLTYLTKQIGTPGISTGGSSGWGSVLSAAVNIGSSFFSGGGGTAATNDAVSNITPGLSSAGDWISGKSMPIRSASSGGSVTIVNNHNFKQEVHTPDIQSFRSSRATQAQNFYRAVKSTTKR